MKQAAAIFRFLLECADRGERAVLVTLTGVTGSAARAPGEHMAVAEDGRSLGSFSGGCVEAAVIAEAQQVLAAGQARLVRYGVGSRYIDIRLPCGGGIDLLFTPTPDRAQLDGAVAVLDARHPVTLRLSRDGGLTTSRWMPGETTGWDGSEFLACHDPVMRVVVIGHGDEPAAMMDIALIHGAEVRLLSPQSSLVDAARRKGIEADVLRFLGRADQIPTDPHSAVVMLFHDHDWETGLLSQVLEGRPFYIGSMGSRRTHAERRHRLLEAGADPTAVDRIVGPAGLIAATRDPRTLALSIMAQIVQVHDAEVAIDRRRTAPRALNEPHQSVEDDA